MSSQVIHSYCRLCAALCPCDNTVDLAVDNKKLEEVINKLLRFNLVYEWSETWLPKTVCYSCEMKLNTAYNFVIAVEYAQDDLNVIFLGHTAKSSSTDVKQTQRNNNSNTVDTHAVYTETSANKTEAKKLKKEISFIDMNKSKCTDVDDKRCYKDILIPFESMSKDIESSTYNESGKHTSPKLTWEDYIWSCKFCSEQYLTFEELKTHSIENHNCCNAYRCSDCGVRKFSLNKFLKHVARHKPYLKRSCHICLVTFPYLKDMNEHMFWHKKSKRKLTEYACGGCNTMFPNPEDLAKHIKVYFDTTTQKITSPIIDKLSDYTNLKCLKCDKGFKEKYLLRRHVMMTHVEKNAENVCDKCGKCFLEKGTLTEHMQKHDDLRPFQCEICKSMYKTKRQLREHVKTHYPEKPFSCLHCGNRFRLKKQLKAHEIIHSNVLPYVCSFCEKAFRTDYRLKQHIRQHTGDKPYSCDVCKQAFTNRPNCYKHMKRIHKIDMAKKKRTADGTFPINPMTGEIVQIQQTTEILRWKEEVLNPKRKGKAKTGMEEKGFHSDLTLVNLVQV